MAFINALLNKRKRELKLTVSVLIYKNLGLFCFAVMPATRHIFTFIRLAKNSSGERNHKQLSNAPHSAISWRY